MCVLSSCPGGTASNIVAFIAKGEMGLSIMMTTASTLAAIVMTPLLTTWLVGTLVPVDPRALFMSTLQVALLRDKDLSHLSVPRNHRCEIVTTTQVVLAPVLLGAFLNQRYPAVVSRLAKFTPCIATMLIALIGKLLFVP